MVGGETAEMPGTYEKGKFDIAGFAVGIVAKNKILGKKIKSKNLILAIPSRTSLKWILISKTYIKEKKNKYKKKYLFKGRTFKTN